MRRGGLIAAVTAIALQLIAVSPVRAAPVGGLVVRGTATFFGGSFSQYPFACPSNCYGSFEGRAWGRLRDTATNTPIVCMGCVIDAGFVYDEPYGRCVNNTLMMSPGGGGGGTLTIHSEPNVIYGQFGYTRLGIALILSVSFGNAVAKLVPPTACEEGTVQVAGVMAIY